jgi:GNAT superfamily N-acetyltransferase
LSRIGGPGVFEELNEEWLDALLREFRDGGVRRVFVNEVPGGLDADVAAKLTRVGLRHYNNWVKLYRDCSSLPPADCNLAIREIGDEDALSFGRIFAPAAGWPDICAEWLASLIGRPGWHTLGAFDDSRLVATGALFVSDHTGALTFAATHPDYRGRGAQAALIRRRIEIAASLGCDLLSVETGQNRPGHPMPSHRNVLRAGFKEAYVRGNYVWTDDAS